METKGLEEMEAGEFLKTEYSSVNVTMMRVVTVMVFHMTMIEMSGTMAMQLITNPTLLAAREEKEIMDPMEILEILVLQVILGQQVQLVRMVSMEWMLLRKNILQCCIICTVSIIDRKKSMDIQLLFLAVVHFITHHRNIK